MVCLERADYTLRSSVLLPHTMPYALLHQLFTCILYHITNCYMCFPEFCQLF